MRDTRQSCPFMGVDVRRPLCARSRRYDRLCSWLGCVGNKMRSCFYAHLAVQRLTAIVGLALVCGVATASPLDAQHSSLRAWGEWCFDTRGRDGFVVEVCAGVYMSAVLTADGRIYTNGLNYCGEFEVPLLAAGRRYVRMDVGPQGGAAVMDDGNIAVWGEEPGWPPVQPMFPPAPPLPIGLSYTDVAVGSGILGSVIAMRSDNTLVAWGDNTYGQISIPALPGNVQVVKVVCHGATTYLLLSDGTVTIFGRTNTGQNQIPNLPAGVGYVDVYPGRGHQLALRTDGEVVAWGDNSYGQCNVPMLPPGTTYTAIAAGRFHSHAVRSDGVIVSWGLSLGTTPTLDPGNPCLQLAAGEWHAVARLANGRVLTWGVEDFYQSRIPGLVDLQGASPQPLWFTDVAQGWQNTLALTSAGEVVAFGAVLPPPAWFAQYTFQKVEAGTWHSAALTTQGELFAWGNGPINVTSIPPLPPGVVYTDMALSSAHTVALRSDGQAVACGPNQFGETNIPPLPAGSRYVSCDAGDGFTQLVRSDGLLLSFGQGVSGFSVMQPPQGRRYVQVATGRLVTGLLRDDGNVEGYLSGSAGDWPVPQLPAGVYYVQVEAGDAILALLRSDGLVEIAGTVEPQLDPVPPLDQGTSYVQVSAADDTIAARVGPTSTYVGITQGCAGTRTATRLVPRTTPHIGKTLEVRLLDLPQNGAIVAFGWNRIGPVSLTSQGLPGCSQDISIDAAVFVSGQGNAAVFTLPIPDWSGLVGMTFYNQAIVFDAGANGAGAVVSDAAQAVIGHW